MERMPQPSLAAVGTNPARWTDTNVSINRAGQRVFVQEPAAHPIG